LDSSQERIRIFQLSPRRLDIEAGKLRESVLAILAQEFPDSPVQGQDSGTFDSP
jgi:hypothetical protein